MQVPSSNVHLLPAPTATSTETAAFIAVELRLRDGTVVKRGLVALIRETIEIINYGSVSFRRTGEVNFSGFGPANHIFVKAVSAKIEQIT